MLDICFVCILQDKSLEISFAVQRNEHKSFLKIERVRNGGRDRERERKNGKQL